MSPLTESERVARFAELCKIIPDVPRGERIRTVAKICIVDDNTVRIWSCRDTKRPIPQRKLEHLEKTLKEQGILAD